MRIISRFRDYYDSVQVHGQDLEQVYVRMEEKEELGATWPFPWTLPAIYDNTGIKFKTHIIGFCGKIYPCLNLYKYINADVVDDVLCYSFSEVDAFFERNLKKKALVDYYDEKSKRCYSIAFRRTRFKEFFEKAEAQADKHQKRFMDHLSPVFVATLHGRAYGHWQTGYAPYNSLQGEGVDRADPGQKIIWNHSLREYEFVRIKDPYTAFQEISMYLGNMAFPNKPIPEMSDEDMAFIKGFDKYSFRKDKAT